MSVKNQHYYPRFLLKYFANEKEKVYVYNRMADKFHWVKYDAICYHNKMYETNNSFDNILENKLYTYETRIAPIIDRIINSIFSYKDVKMSDKEIDLLWDFLWLQYHRTDAGRIRLINDIEGDNKDREYPVELDEIEKDKYSGNRFNEIYKSDGSLEALLLLTKRPSNMKFYILLCAEENLHLITSDNPVISRLSGKGLKGFQLLMPIHPNIYIKFSSSNEVVYKENVLRMTKQQIQAANEGTINTANYYIIADRPFDVGLTGYIINRFHNPRWKYSVDFC